MPSSAELFDKHIIPVIRSETIKLEQIDSSGHAHEVHLVVGNLRTSFHDMSMSELASLHEKVVMLENDVQAIDNFVKYYRGLVYLTVMDGATQKSS